MEWQTEAATKYQSLQVPIFEYLVKTYVWLNDFQITTQDQYVGLQKQYGDFWVYIEIEDAESLQEIEGYEVWFQHHEVGWYPSNVEEEDESYPIYHSFFETIEELGELIYMLNNDDFVGANAMMVAHPR